MANKQRDWSETCVFNANNVATVLYVLPYLNIAVYLLCIVQTILYLFFSHLFQLLRYFCFYVFHRMNMCFRHDNSIDIEKKDQHNFQF